MAKQLVWNNQGYFETLDDSEIFESQPLYETKTHSFTQSSKSSKKVKQKKSPPSTQVFVWKDNFGFDDELYQKAKTLQKDKNPKRKCPYCKACCKDVNKHIRKAHKGKSELPVVEPSILKELNKNKQPQKKKRKNKLSINKFTEYLKSASKTKIKKLLYLRWDATKPDVTFLEYVGKHNILFTGNFDEDTVEVRMLYNFYTSNRNIIKPQKNETNIHSKKNKKFSSYDKNKDDVYHYSIGETFDSKVYGKSSSYLNKGDHNYRETGRFGSSVVSDDYDN